MSKNKQILIFSVIGLAVLGGVTALLLLTAPAPETEEAPTEPIADESADLVLIDKTAEEVASLHIQNGEDEYDVLPSGETDESGEPLYTVAGLEGANLRLSELKNMVANAASLTARDYVEEGAELTKYGLTEPKATVTVNFADGSDYTFRVGDDVPSSSVAVYFYAEASDTVYTYTKSKLTAFTGDRFSLVETQVMPAADSETGEEVLSLTIERGDLDEPIRIEQIPPSDDPDELSVFTYQLVSPYTVYLDLTNGSAFLQSLFGLTAQSAQWYGMEERDYEISGLDDPSAVLTLVTTKKTYTVTLGRTAAREVTDDDGNVSTEILGVYGMSSEVADTLFLFDYSSIPAATVTADSLMSKLFFMPYIYSLKEVVYEDHLGQTFTLGFEKVKDATESDAAVYRHLLNGEETDEQRLKNIYQYMISAAGDELYLGDGEGELLAEIRYRYADETRGEVAVRFYESTEDRKIIVNINGTNLFKAKQIYLTRLLENVKNYLNGGEIILTY
ncbi:MAG: DUF4340 domain-containing protein [Bacteroides sp.]|nr:DUF4340 domain-containing protein [Eubacterium sp.]MCM1419473.1 DUF4340 domain-containing protein [Roseburia sp.]MCM1463297.1 DUF4340 domain-containing protein [Bacteroides sp.]